MAIEQDIEKTISTIANEQEQNKKAEVAQSDLDMSTSIDKNLKEEPQILSSEPQATSIYEGTGFEPDILMDTDLPFVTEASGRDDIFNILGSIKDTASKFHEQAKGRADTIQEGLSEIKVKKATDEVQDATKTTPKKILEIDEVKQLDNNLSILNLPKTNIKNVEDIKDLLGRLTSRADGTYSLDDLNNLIDEVYAPQLNAARGKTTNLRILAYADSLGLDDVVERIRNKKPNEVLPVEEFVAIGLKADLLNSRIRTLLEGDGFDKVLSSESIVEIQKLMHLLGELRVAARQTSSAYGRGLQANRNNVFKDGDVLSEADTIQQQIGKNIFDETIDPEEFQIVRLQLTDLALKPHQLKDVANNLTLHMGGGRRWMEAWTQLYLNGKLAAPSTAIINLASGVGFRVLINVETLTAGVFNKVFYRNDAMGVRLNAALNETKMLAGGGFLDAASFAYKAIYETPDITKLDMRKKNFMTVENLAPSLANHPYAKGADFLLNVTNVPAKSLIVGDQLIKGWTYAQKIEYLATKKMNIAIQKGTSVEDAKALYNHVRKYPTSDMLEEAYEEMLTATFQRTIDNKFYQNFIRNTMNHPLMKIHQPFTNTLANIYVEGVGKRSLLGLANKNIRNDVLGRNGIEAQQLAIARMTLGNSFFFASMLAATSDWGFFDTFGAGTHTRKDVVLIGSYPGDPGMQQFWKSNNIIPHSIGFLQDDGTYKFVPYEGVGEPLSFMLSVAADASYAITRPGTTDEDQKNLMTIINNVMIAFVDHTKDEAFLKNLSVLGHVLNTEPKEGENILISFLTESTMNIGANYMEYIANPVINFGGYYPNSFANFVQKKRRDFYEENMMTSNQQEWYRDYINADVPEWVAGSYRIINGIINRSGWSNIVDLKTNRAKNVWYEEMKLPETGATFYGQITTSKNLEEFYLVEQWQDQNGFYLSLPNRNFKGIAPLNNDEYDRLIYLMNNSADGKEENIMLKQMNKLFTADTEYARIFQNAGFNIQKGYIERIRRQRLKYAIEQLKKESPRLAAMEDIADAEYRMQTR